MIYAIYTFFFWRLYYLVFVIIAWIVLDTFYHLLKLKAFKNYIPEVRPEIFLFKILFRMPKLIAIRLNDLRSDEFKAHGLYIFCGEQGAGKTMSMTYNINRLFMKYPQCKIFTNYGLMIEDKPLEDAFDLLKYNNGYSGLIFGIDEIQATFNSRSWKDFPPDLLATVCQNRKSHRVIFSTAQSVSQVDKAIRLQTRRFINNYTLFGFLTVSLWYKPYFDFEGNLEKAKLRKIQIFLQEEELRYQYNTFDIIKSMTKEKEKKEV